MSEVLVDGIPLGRETYEWLREQAPEHYPAWDDIGAELIPPPMISGRLLYGLMTDPSTWKQVDAMREKNPPPLHNIRRPLGWAELMGPPDLHLVKSGPA